MYVVDQPNPESGQLALSLVPMQALAQLPVTWSPVQFLCVDLRSKSTSVGQLEKQGTKTGTGICIKYCMGKDI